MTIVLLALIVLLAPAAAPVLAHDGEPPPPPPNAPVEKKTRTVMPPRWSWLHWWEANREAYLRGLSQEPPDQGPIDEQLKAQRARASELLVDLLKTSDHDSLLVEAALAVGKLQHVPALPALKELVNNSDSDRVREAAITAIGLIGSPEAEAALVAFGADTRGDRLTGLAAIGFLPKIEAATLEQLRAVVSDENPAIVTIACWSLRQHHQDDSLAYYGRLLESNDSPWVASEALLALGLTDEPRALYVLSDVLLGRPGADKVKAWEELRHLHELNVQLMQTARERRDQGKSYDQLYEDYRKRYEVARKRNPNLPPPEDKRQVRAGPTVTVGAELIRLAWLRASAAVALGQFPEEPDAGEALCEFVEAPADEDVYLIMPKGFALMALAGHPTPRSRDRLIALVGKTDDRGQMVLDAPKDSPLRGFAAVSLGLYAQPRETAQGPADLEGYDWAMTTLAERLDDPREDLEVRVASAIGLGLTRRAEVLPVLHRATEGVRLNLMPEHPLYGYLLLARALAGDQSIIEPAAKYLSGRDDVSMNGILARRAAVLALGVTRSSSAVPVLTQAWHLNHYVNREVIIALRLIGGGSAASAVMERLEQTADDEERAYMAQALGELFAQQRPTPLVKLTAQSNFAVRNDQLLPLQKLSNGFLFEYLIPSFGDLW